MWNEFSFFSLLSSKDALSHWAGEENKPWNPKKSHFPLPWKVIALYSNWVLWPSADQGWGFKLLQAQELTPRLKGGGYAQKINNNLINSLNFSIKGPTDGVFHIGVPTTYLVHTEKGSGYLIQKPWVITDMWTFMWSIWTFMWHLCHQAFIQIRWKRKKTSLLQRLWGEREWDTNNQ